jgi:hypothetical protein
MYYIFGQGGGFFKVGLILLQRPGSPSENSMADEANLSGGVFLPDVAALL